MKVIMLYKPHSEFARGAEEYVHEFERRTAKTIESVNFDSPEGAHLAELYGVVDHPTFLAIADDGQLLHAWAGKPLPLINEISAYAGESLSH